MKKIIGACVLAAWTLLLLPAASAPPEAGPEGAEPGAPAARQPPRSFPGRPPGHEGLERPRPERGGPPDSPGARRPGGPPPGIHREGEGAPLDRWMSFLRERNPEEFERWQRLREEDPEAFREAIRERLDAARERFREQAGDRPAGGDGPWGPRFPPPPPDPRGPQAGGLAQAWREAGSAEERERIERQIRRHVAESVQVRFESHERRLAELEREVMEMRRNLSRQREMAERMIERRTQDLIRRWEAEPEAD